MISELNERSRNVFRYIVDAYLESGTPVGSRLISQKHGLNLSSATIRNVMVELEQLGLLCSPHTSAGRLPTQAGLRVYVDGLLEIGDISKDERERIDSACRAAGSSVNTMLEQAGTLLSGLSAGAGLVLAPKTDQPVHQIQFVNLEVGKTLAVLVMKDGMVENRIIETTGDISASSLTSATNYLNSRLAGKTLLDAKHKILAEIEDNRAQLDKITSDLIKKGIALEPEGSIDGHIIIRGQSKLLDDVKAIEELEHARTLFDALEERETMAKLLITTQEADGVQIFIGAENAMFEHSGWSVILSPYKNKESKVIGAIGVIGPTRLNYGRVIPIVDYTSQVMSKVISSV